MDVVFPVMPFADAGRPSMGVSLLSSEARKAGYSTSVQYCNFRLAERLGLTIYQTIATSFPPNLLLGEWFFADILFGNEIPSAEEYIEDVFARAVGTDGELLQKIMEVRRQRRQFLDQCVQSIMAEDPKIVGFSTTFHQTCACLALARRLKRLPDPPVIVFGGANCEGEMGLQMIRSFEWIDFICCGEADISFIRLLDRILGDGAGAPIPGVLEQGKAEEVVRSEAITDMDALPYPDFDGFFRDFSGSALEGLYEPHLVFETSRGCWWGAKHHCTFCGLNGDTMVFRSKSPERALAEIEYLMDRHGALKLGCVDNILDMRYIDTLFPRLAEAGYELDIFYEVKANLRYAQLKKMREGGVSQIQPGIESFSDQVLKLMEKGCTGLQNIQLMRWCEELGIEVSWNVLAGFPEEDPAEYERTAALMPLLTHLAPPVSCGLVRLDRFSPFHSRAAQFGFRQMRPARAYYYVFPFGRQELSRLAYYFDFDYGDGRDPKTYVMPVQREVQNWLAARSRGVRLDAWFDGGRVRIEDTRPVAVAALHEFEGLAAEIYARCDTATTPEVLCEALQAPQDLVQSALDDLIRRRLTARSGDRYLSLAVFRRRPEQPEITHARGAGLRVPQAATA